MRPVELVSTRATCGGVEPETAEHAGSICTICGILELIDEAGDFGAFSATCTTRGRVFVPPTVSFFK